MLILYICLVAPQNSVADETTLALGAFDISGSAELLMQVEYDPGAEWAGLNPQLGLFVTEQSSGCLYLGLGYPLQLAERWTVVPSVSAGYYHSGADRDLGYDLEFYSQLQARYWLSVDSSLGIALAHISTAGLGDKNPGANLAYLSYSFGS